MSDTRTFTDDWDYVDDPSYLEHFNEIMFSKLERGELDEATENHMIHALCTITSKPKDPPVLGAEMSSVEASLETDLPTSTSAFLDEDELILHVDDSEWFPMDVEGDHEAVLTPVVQVVSSSVSISTISMTSGVPEITPDFQVDELQRGIENAQQVTQYISWRW